MESERALERVARPRCCEEAVRPWMQHTEAAAAAAAAAPVASRSRLALLQTIVCVDAASVVEACRLLCRRSTLSLSPPLLPPLLCDALLTREANNGSKEKRADMHEKKSEGKASTTVAAASESTSDRQVEWRSNEARTSDATAARARRATTALSEPEAVAAQAPPQPQRRPSASASECEGTAARSRGGDALALHANSRTAAALLPLQPLPQSTADAHPLDAMRYAALCLDFSSVHFFQRGEFALPLPRPPRTAATRTHARTASSRRSMTKNATAPAAAAASRIPQLKSASQKKVAAAAPTAAVGKSSSQKKLNAAAAAAADSDAVPPPQQPKSAKKKKSLTPAAAAVAAEDEDADEITLFHPATSVTAAPVSAEPAAAASAAAEDEDEDEDDVSSPSFLASLVSKQVPELLAVLADLKSKVSEVRRGGVRPLVGLTRSSPPSLPTDQGMSFLELKNHLLLQYLQHLVMFVMIKLAPPADASASASSAKLAKAASERQEAVVRQLVYLRSVLEKLRPLDKKLKYQVDKMSKLAAHINLKAVEAAQRGEDAEAAAMQAEAAANGATDADADMTNESSDPLSFRPNPAALLAATADAARANAEAGASTAGAAGGANGGSGLASGASGLYRPPRISATQLDDADRATTKRNKDLARAQERAKSNVFMTAMRAELSERPEERELDLDDMRPRDSEEQDRQDFEETNLLRLTDTRVDKARRKEKRRAAKNTLGDLAGEFDDFRDVQRLRGRGEGEELLSEERMEQLKGEAAPRKRKRFVKQRRTAKRSTPADTHTQLPIHTSPCSLSVLSLSCCVFVSFPVASMTMKASMMGWSLVTPRSAKVPTARTASEASSKEAAAAVAVARAEEAVEEEEEEEEDEAEEEASDKTTRAQLLFPSPSFPKASWDVLASSLRRSSARNGEKCPILQKYVSSDSRRIELRSGAVDAPALPTLLRILLMKIASVFSPFSSKNSLGIFAIYK